ncbi:MAG TPA: DUF2785 domain-containing protein [Candidatus Solibacter sp.]|nr:DUF2785 domain-containing protein [Candidatus Solibacter sp.]
MPQAPHDVILNSGKAAVRDLTSTVNHHCIQPDHTSWRPPQQPRHFSALSAAFLRVLCGKKLFARALVPAVLALLASNITAQTQHPREFWRSIANNHYAVPEGEQPFPLAQELSGYLSLPDPELRDDLAYSILDVWIVRKRLFTPAQLNRLLEDWQGSLRSGIGDRGTDTVFRRSFSALCLSALAERELKDLFLTEAQYRELLKNTLTYMHDERDLRGFDATKGWIHATAHTADLLAALAENRFFTKDDQATLLAAISERLATAGEIFTYGEQDRLANVAATIAARDDFDSASFSAWLKTLDSQDQTVWKKSPPDVQALARFENDSYFLRALASQLAGKPPTEALSHAQKEALSILNRR